MSDSFDDFFDDEQELAATAAGLMDKAGEAHPVQEVGPAGDHPADEDEAQAESVPEGAGDASSMSNAVRLSQCEAAVALEPHAAPERKAPPFWMVLAIAGISLLLGMVIGYLAGTSSAIAELEANVAQNAQQQEDRGGSVSMPEGHPDVEVGEDGTASLADGTDGSTAKADDLTLANNYFDMGMSAMNAASDEAGKEQARGLFAQAITHYDAYLAQNESAPAEVDRAISVFYTGDHEGAIAALEAFTKRDSSFAPAWANLGMFYESHGDTGKAIEAYEHAVAAAEKDDTYGVGDYARGHLDALKK